MQVALILVLVYGTGRLSESIEGWYGEANQAKLNELSQSARCGIDHTSYTFVCPSTHYQ